MSYTNQTLVEVTLAQAIVTANPANLTMPVKLVNLGTRANVNTIPPTEFNFFIAQADAIIDAALSQQYAVPLVEKCDFSMTLMAEVSEYSDNFTVADYSNLSIGDELVITDGVNQERLIVLCLSTPTTFTVEMMPTNSYAVGTRVLRVKFPEPITYIASRLAAAMIYDKHLKAQTDPAKSDYGDLLRKNAIADLNNIRAGRTILEAPRTGWRFANPNLVSRYAVKGQIEQDNTIEEPNQ
jgi:hypothetical protein